MGRPCYPDMPHSKEGETSVKHEPKITPIFAQDELKPIFEQEEIVFEKKRTKKGIKRIDL